MERIAEAVRETFLLEEDVEFTIEANPGTLTMEKLETYRKLGVNRLSLGLQSADNDELNAWGESTHMKNSWKASGWPGRRDLGISMWI